MTPDELKERFRRDVDDVRFDPEYDVDLLFSEDDVDYYLDEAHHRFVVETYYLFEKLTLPVSKGIDHVHLPVRFLELRGDTVYLVNAGWALSQADHDSNRIAGDDYGAAVSYPPVFRTQDGTPRLFSLDIEAERLTLFPTPVEDDCIEMMAYMAPRPVSETGRFAMRDSRHIRMLLPGMKALAYAKQDADVYDPNQAARWEEQFQQEILKAQSERLRRRRTPSVVRYGGL